MNRKVIDSYLKAAKKNCPRKYKKQLSEELENSLLEFCEGKENVTKQAVENKFGDPRQYAAEFFSTYGEAEFAKEVRRMKRTRMAIVAAIVLAALLLLGTVAFIIRWNQEHKAVYVYYNVSEGAVVENED